MKTDEAKTDAEEQDIQERLVDALDEAEWLERDGYYRAIVHLGGDDHAVVCALPGSAAEGLLELLPDVIEQLGALEELELEDMAQQLRTLVGGPLSEDLWPAIDAVVATSLVDWDLTEYCEATRTCGADLPVPNADIDDASVRMEILREKLDLRIVARIVCGAVWLTKNF